MTDPYQLHSSQWGYPSRSSFSNATFIDPSSVEFQDEEANVLMDVAHFEYSNGKQHPEKKLPAQSSLPNPSVSSESPILEKERHLTGAKKLLWEHNPSLFFSDGLRKIDFILVWDASVVSQACDAAQLKRHVFEANLEREGLEIESQEGDGHTLHFVKVHAPQEVLSRYAEILKLRMPMKKIRPEVMEAVGPASLEFLNKIPGMLQIQNVTNEIVTGVKSRFDQALDYIKPDPILFPPKEQRFTAVFSRDKEYLFDMNEDEFYTSSMRSRIVDFILKRKRFREDTEDEFAFGIERLLAEGAYGAAYPLHDGSLKADGNLRSLLAQRWATLREWYRYQPLDYVKEYFGVKIGLYFAWLGFYTHTLIWASIVGVLCFMFGVSTMRNNLPSDEICSGKLNHTMCPACDHFCDYWYLGETCLHTRVTYLFDNATTVFFAIFMSFWAAIFLELWKRYSAEITHRWDLTGFDAQEEHPRPQYLARLAHVKSKKVNVITNTLEPRVPFWKMKFPATLLSVSLVLLLVCLALSAVIGVILYRMSTLAALSIYGDSIVTSYAMLFTTATAASLNLACILVFNKFYERMAVWLTELELLRTQSEFEDSLTLKMYLLQFVNHYASIFYIAFFKGKFVGYPGKYNRFLGYRQEECGPGGCLMELCIQLAIIMVGKQAMNSILEMVWPMVFKWLNTLKVRTGLGQRNNYSNTIRYRTQWTQDYKLVPWGTETLFGEYLEMVLQYGFVTIFVAAFPLAPLFALLNNILEMRLDARKILTLHRRPVAQRVKDIGIWYSILDGLGKLAVVTNGFIIAFTSDFIPRLVYTIRDSPDGTLAGYLNHSLAAFNTSDFPEQSRPVIHLSQHVELCYYQDHRNPPDSVNPYEHNANYWIIMAARLAFVVVFQNVVACLVMLVQWAIPDMARSLSDQIRQEAYLTNEIIIKQEMIRARGRQAPGAVQGDATAWDPTKLTAETNGAAPGQYLRRTKSSEPRANARSVHV